MAVRECKASELTEDVVELQMDGCVGWRNCSLTQLVEAVWEMVVSPDSKWTWTEAEEVLDGYLSGEY